MRTRIQLAHTSRASTLVRMGDTLHPPFFNVRCVSLLLLICDMIRYNYGKLKIDKRNSGKINIDKTNNCPIHLMFTHINIFVLIVVVHTMSINGSLMFTDSLFIHVHLCQMLILLHSYNVCFSFSDSTQK
jgi:hypothetical protein